MNSNKDKLYIKIIASNAIYNFVVKIFQIKIILGPQNIFVSL